MEGILTAANVRVCDRGRPPPARRFVALAPRRSLYHRQAGCFLKLLPNNGFDRSAKRVSHPSTSAVRVPGQLKRWVISTWHPQAWDIHIWSKEDGMPTICFNNPKDPGSGVQLPKGAFYYLVNGRKQPPPKSKER